jgi:hypothetical protein
VPDAGGDEPTGEDQTLCLYDRPIVDDLLHADLAAFAPGVRIVMVADSCHSGTVAKAMFGDGGPDDEVARGVPPTLAHAIYAADRAAYDPQRTATVRAAARTVRASVLLLAACQDRQEAKDGPVHGRFTRALLAAWDDGAYLASAAASYRDLVARITAAIAEPSQVPHLFQTGAADPGFPDRAPFVR